MGNRKIKKILKYRGHDDNERQDKGGGEKRLKDQKIKEK